ncbi:ABC transporter ATP-binding protein [Flaviaesturariibacter flavus]|uniref:ABC transporter ATP-binding protein n=1 Tax=Flaviaesturariibacter flavus TaxID=2502780 RepID=A0A4R1BMC3_9BACT|nr:ATP-binding cassette domain-containing protein [Flaviaesturariibacter flavus]TCJ18650.1 ABC transporter ATP-binding protein [Flaviaesturariibacter flavus]
MIQHNKEEILLQAEGVCRSIAGTPILSDISFTIRNITRPGVAQGQVVSLIGRSGIGKTQLFRLLAGLQPPDSGSIRIDGRPVQAGDMGVVFQNYYLFEWRTIGTSLVMAARQNPALKSTARDAVAEAAARFGLSDRLQAYPQELSGGQRQRAAILQQLLKGADFLLLDEPFSGLDVYMLEKASALLREVSLSNERKTLIIVSHDISAAVALSDTVYILGRKEGKRGATITSTIDLIERDLAWDPEVRQRAAFRETVAEIGACISE